MLARLKLEGFKSIQNLGTTGLMLNRINVLIGENGAGKSNLVSFFKMLNFMTVAEAGLQFWVAKEGGASDILFYGAKATSKLSAALEFRDDQGCYDYVIELAPAAGDNLIFVAENSSFKPNLDDKGYKSSTGFGTGHREPKLREYAVQNKLDTTAQRISQAMSSLSVLVIQQVAPYFR